MVTVCAVGGSLRSEDGACRMLGWAGMSFQGMVPVVSDTSEVCGSGRLRWFREDRGHGGYNARAGVLRCPRYSLGYSCGPIYARCSDVPNTKLDGSSNFTVVRVFPTWLMAVVALRRFYLPLR